MTFKIEQVVLILAGFILCFMLAREIFKQRHSTVIWAEQWSREALRTRPGTWIEFGYRRDGTMMWRERRPENAGTERPIKPQKEG